MEQYEFDNYVILDDLELEDFYDHQHRHLVVTDPKLGLTYWGVESAVKILKGERYVQLSKKQTVTS